MLKEGDKAPAFNLESDEGGNVSLQDFGNTKLVLYFYPRDNTPGCTRQAQGFTAAKKLIEAAGGKVVGVSRDSIKSHAGFRTKCGLGITLLSDPDLSVHRAYGAFGEKMMYGKKIEGVLRTTFVIDQGKVVRVFPNVKVDGHADAVLRALQPNQNEETMAAKKSAKKSSGKSESLGEQAGEFVAKQVGKLAKAIAPAKKKAKATAKKAVAGAKDAVKKTAAKVKKKAGGAKKKASSAPAKKKTGGAKKKAASKK